MVFLQAPSIDITRYELFANLGREVPFNVFMVVAACLITALLAQHPVIIICYI